MTDGPPGTPTKSRPTTAQSSHAPGSSIAVLTICGVAALHASTGSISVTALGLSHAVLQVVSFQLIERAGGAGQHGDDVDGLLSQIATSSDGDKWISVLRDVATAATATTVVAAIFLESSHFGGLQYYGLLGQAMGDHWIFGQAVLTVFYALGTVLVHMALFGALVFMVSRASCVRCCLIALLVHCSPCPCRSRHVLCVEHKHNGPMSPAPSLSYSTTKSNEQEHQLTSHRRFIDKALFSPAPPSSPPPSAHNSYSISASRDSGLRRYVPLPSSSLLVTRPPPHPGCGPVLIALQHWRRHCLLFCWPYTTLVNPQDTHILPFYPKHD